MDASVVYTGLHAVARLGEHAEFLGGVVGVPLASLGDLAQPLAVCLAPLKSGPDGVAGAESGLLADVAGARSVAGCAVGAGGLGERLAKLPGIADPRDAVECELTAAGSLCL